MRRLHFVCCVILTGLLFCLTIPVHSQSPAPSSTPSPSPNPQAAAATSGVIDESQLAGLPMNGRSYTQLTTLQAGVADPGGGGSQGGGGGISVSGGRQEWNSFLLDGTDINNTGNQVPGSAAGGQLGSDTIRQVQVFSVNYGAQYGRAAGGVMNAITRSGGSDWHGTIFEFLRNSKLDAREFFDKGSDPPPFKRNQFGATVTGPIFADRTFFMAGVELLRNRLTTTQVNLVPDNQLRTGILSLPGRPSVVARDDVKPYLNLYPSADFPILQNGLPTGIAENRNAVSQPSNEYFFTFRLDHRLREKDAVFGRYTFSDANRTSGGGSSSFLSLTQSRQQYATFVETHFFSPAAVNTIRLGYTRPVSRTVSQSTISIPANLFFVPGAPQFGVINVSGLDSFGPNSSLPSAEVMNSYQAADDFIFTRGPHTWKFGFQMERFQWNVFSNPSVGAEWTFNSLEDFLRAGPNKDNSLRVALPGSSAERAYRQSLFGLYLQNDFKARPNLTLNMGLRYEFTSLIHDAQSRDVFLKDELRDTEPQVGALMGRNPSLKNLAPRFGFSWSLWSNPSKLLVSGGFGVYFDQIIEYGIDPKRATLPIFKLSVLTNVSTSGTFPNALRTVDAQGGGLARQARIMEYDNPKTPTVYRYNFSLQREIIPGLRMEAMYVGYRANALLRNFEANLYPFPVTMPDGSLFFPPNTGPRNPNFNVIEKTSTDAQAFYNSFVLSLNPRPWHGLSVRGNYTFAKGIDDVSSTNRFVDHYGIDRTLNRGLGKFVNRHRLSMNYFFDLPLGGGRRWLTSGWLAQALGGWRIGGIMNIRTSQPFETIYRISTPGYLFISRRPNLVAGRSNNHVSGVSTGCGHIPAGTPLGTRELYFDPCDFSAPAPGIIGNAGRNTMIGPRTVSMDLSLQKEFSIDSERALEFRAEFFNFPNHTNFSFPNDGSATIFRNAAGTLNPNAGRLTSTNGTPRQIQFALRLNF
ncbi:MAG: hypothetical protein A3F68_00195 [Acidobacteria bacterium RIFCSPLOWO2_12_FULL_54_10]|nr:MAG: hypothetical protein A3F68_00195 [Acidobacteria bacterium RIFCSPLOWO2_12_FULL_54_10]